MATVGLRKLTIPLALLVICAGCRSGSPKETLLSPPVVGQPGRSEALDSYGSVLKELTNKKNKHSLLLICRESKLQNSLAGYLNYYREPESLPAADLARQACYINLYNGWMLWSLNQFRKQTEITDWGIWQGAVRFIITDETFSFKELGEAILKNGDWRAELTLAGPRITDPPLFCRPFDGEELNEQLDWSVCRYLKDDSGYQDDFEGRRILFGPVIMEHQGEIFSHYQEVYGGLIKYP